MVLASVGNYSGVPGSATFPMVQGAQVWVKYINAKGGLNGHKVQLIVYDDQSDPARHKAMVQEAVERRRVIGFLQQGAILTGASSMDYLNGKRVPVIGSTGGERYAYEHPMFFPTFSTGPGMWYSGLFSFAQQLSVKGSTKLATVYCAEVQECASMDKAVADHAKAEGLDVVYRAKASLAAPDFTDHCLAARNAGANAAFVIGPENTVGRFAASCIRQAYRPVFLYTPQGATDRQKDDPNLEGAVSYSLTFPYFQSGTPATDEYQQAMKDFGPNVQIGGPAAIGWVSGKVLEKAGAQLPEPPTTEALLTGLWSIKGETLGGLTPVPLTYVKDRPAPGQACWYNMQIRKGAWVSPDAFGARCRNFPT